MQRFALIAFVITLFIAPVGAHAAPGTCERLEQQRERVYTQLRRPHSATRANQLHARLRELDAKIRQACR